MHQIKVPYRLLTCIKNIDLLQFICVATLAQLLRVISVYLQHCRLTTHKHCNRVIDNTSFLFQIYHNIVCGWFFLFFFSEELVCFVKGKKAAAVAVNTMQRHPWLMVSVAGNMPRLKFSPFSATLLNTVKTYYTKMQRAQRRLWGAPADGAGAPAYIRVTN